MYYYYQFSQNQHSQHSFKKYAKALLQSSQIVILVTLKMVITSTKFRYIK